MKMIIALKMEAATTSETSVNFCQTHDATSQKTVIFDFSGSG
jgi:hypothetical protein